MKLWNYDFWMFIRLTWWSQNLIGVILIVMLLVTIPHNVRCAASSSSAATRRSSRNSATSTHSESSSFTLQDYVNVRCGNNDCNNDAATSGIGINPSDSAVWLYDGVLIDPLDGKQIAAVEGIELVRHVATLDAHQSVPKFERRCRNLRILKSVTVRKNNNKNKKHQNPTDQLVVAPNLNSCSTLLSRKLFLYKPISTSSEEKTKTGNSKGKISRGIQKKIKPLPKSATPYTSFLLRQIRRRPPTGPVTQIPIDQSIQVYDSAITIMEKKQNKQSAAILGTSNNHQWIFHTEFADGTTLQSASTDIIPNSDTGKNGIVFTTYTRSTSKKKQATIPDLINSDHQINDKRLPKSRTSTIQFGSSPETEKGRFGARETYMYQWNNNDNNNNNNDDQKSMTDNKSTSTPIRVQYTRYGEAPAWYGPGRFCLLELTGRRIMMMPADTTMLHPPTLAQSLAAYIPGFWKPDEPISIRFPPTPLLDSARTTSQQSMHGRSSKKFTQKANVKDDDDVHYKYYSDALCNQLFISDGDNKIDRATMPTIARTASEYRELFADLRMGRIIDQFRESQVNRIELSKTAKQPYHDSKKGVLLPIYTALDSNDAGTSNQVSRFWTQRIRPTINDSFYRAKSALSFSI